MEFVVKKSSLEKCLKTIDSHTDEAFFKVVNKELIYCGLEPSQIALLKIKMSVDCVEEGCFAFTTKSFLKALSCFNDELININILDNKIKIGSGKKAIKINRFDGEKIESKIPQTDYSVKIINIKNLSKLLKDAEKFSSHITFDNKLISGAGDEGDYQFEFEGNIDGVGKATYPLGQLISLVSNCGEVISIEWKNDSPLRITFINDDVYGEYYLAPRVENI